jgi:hypothetical protein
MTKREDSITPLPFEKLLKGAIKFEMGLNKKTAELVLSLLERTEEGSMPWTPGYEDAFVADFPAQAVKIKMEQVFLTELDDASLIYALEVLNKDFQVVKVIRSDVSLDVMTESWEVLRGLYESARGHALGANEMIDGLIGHLSAL